jgi:hypothetical protein
MGSSSTGITLTGGTLSASGSGNYRTTITFAGNVTVSGSIPCSTGSSFVYSSGTITTTGSTLSLAGTTTFNTSGMTWNQVNCGTTMTLNSTLSVTTLQIPDSNVTFNGTSGFSAATLTNSALSASRVWTLKSGITYSVTSAMTITAGATASRRSSFVASTPGTKALLNLQSGAVSLIAFCDPTDIGSSGGIPIYTYSGTITTSTNWVAGSLTLPAASNVKTGKMS